MATSTTLHDIRVSGTCANPTASKINTGNHVLPIDEPKERGGTDTGATPLEVLLSSLAGCTNVISNRIAKEMEVEIEIKTIKVIGSLDMNVLAGNAVDSVFPRIHLNVEVKSAAGEQAIDELKKKLAQRCPVSVLLRQAGSEIIEQWSIVND